MHTVHDYIKSDKINSFYLKSVINITLQSIKIYNGKNTDNRDIVRINKM